MTLYWAAISPVDNATVLEIMQLPDNIVPGVNVGDQTRTFIKCAANTPFPSTYANGLFTPKPVISTLPFPIYADRVMASKLAAGITVNVAATGQTAVYVMCDGVATTQASLALLALWGQAFPAGTKTWVDNQGGSTQLKGVELVTLATDVGNWIDNMYAFLGQLLVQYAGGQIVANTAADMAIWPTA
jgi:hypothetical protein